MVPFAPIPNKLTYRGFARLAWVGVPGGRTGRSGSDRIGQGGGASCASYGTAPSRTPRHATPHRAAQCQSFSQFFNNPALFLDRRARAGPSAADAKARRDGQICMGLGIHPTWRLVNYYYCAALRLRPSCGGFWTTNQPTNTGAATRVPPRVSSRLKQENNNEWMQNHLLSTCRRWCESQRSGNPFSSACVPQLLRFFPADLVRLPHSPMPVHICGMGMGMGSIHPSMMDESTHHGIAFRLL